MGLTRREFLTWAGFSAMGAVVLNACGIPERELVVQSPVQLPEDLVKGTDNWYATLCRKCDSGCGIAVRVMEGRAKKIEGNLDFPINQGRHSAKCEAGLQDMYHPDRIAKPLRRVGTRGSGNFQEIDWDTALNTVVGQLKDLQGEADTVAVVTNPMRGSLSKLTERFATAYGASYLKYEALESTTLRATMKKLLGQDALPDFDLENAKFLLSFGSDFLGTWVSPTRFSRGFGHFRQGVIGGRSNSGDGEVNGRGTFIQVEPRLSHTAANADMWIPIKPGMEGALAMSIAYVIIVEIMGDNVTSSALSDGVDMDKYRPEVVADSLGIPKLRGKEPVEVIRNLAHQLVDNSPSIVIGGGPAAAHTNGLDNMLAIYSLNHLLGTINKKGGIIFNPSSSMKEIPTSADVTSFDEWHNFIDRLRWGRPKPVNMMLVYGTDPVYSSPGSLDIPSALGDTYVVSFSNFLDDTTLYSDLVLPLRMYLEDWGDEIPEPAPQYATVGFQQPVVNPPEEIDVKGGFGDLLLAISEDLGGTVKEALPWKTFRDMMREHAKELFKEGAGSVQANDFDSFWTGVLQRGGWWNKEARSGDSVPTPHPLPQLKIPEYSGPTEEESQSFYLMPFEHVVIGDGRNAHLPWLQATPDPISSAVWTTWVEINSSRAEELELVRGDVVALESKVGHIEAIVFPHPAVPPDVLGVPIGQGHKDFGRYAASRGSNVFELIDPQKKDKETGSLAWAATRVWLAKTGRRVDIPRFEGNVPPIEPEEDRIIGTSRE